MTWEERSRRLRGTPKQHPRKQQKSQSFGQYVKAMREQRGMSGRQLADRVGVANTTVMDIENGTIPQPNLFIALIDALELNAITAVKLAEPYRRIYERIITATREGGSNE